MALTKMISEGDELHFDLSNIASSAKKEISVILRVKSGRMAVLSITAHRSIPITHNKMNQDRKE